MKREPDRNMEDDPSRASYSDIRHKENPSDGHHNLLPLTPPHPPPTPRCAPLIASKSYVHAVAENRAQVLA